MPYNWFSPLINQLILCLFEQAHEIWFLLYIWPGPEVITLFVMLNSTEYEIYIAHKYLNANYCWHLNIYKQDKYNF